MEFEISDKNLVLNKCYEENDNYKVLDVGNGDICYVFFSSNGIYYPNELECFQETIERKDRYEWWGVGHSKEVLDKAGRIIYVRDIYKQYYVKGINKGIATIDALCERLKYMTEGKKVITCGTSSGGYIATIVGMYLKAECIFNFGGQWSLEEIIDRNYLLKKYENDIFYNKYYNISRFAKDNRIPIFYFYSALNDNDVKQFQFLKEKENIFVFAMKSKEHGWLLFNNCYRKLLSKSTDEIKKISRKYEGKLISQRKICFDLLDRKEALNEVKDDIIRSHKSIQMMIQWLKGVQ